MLAPMQGLTNVALRQLFIEQVQPDVVFTEFLQVRPGSRYLLKPNECREITEQPEGTPLVVQLMGSDTDALVKAAEAAEQAGAKHININMGCPYGRMVNNSAGGALLKQPGLLPKTLDALRASIQGSFSVKLRAGHDQHNEVYDLLPLFEAAGVDFLILHPRTVIQRYDGAADHKVTQQVCALTSLPVIANGDINRAEDGQQLLRESGAAGLMMGRGAIADPWLFARLRGERPMVIDQVERRKEVKAYLLALLQRYQPHFCGDIQVLFKLKEVVNLIQDEWFHKPRKALRKCKKLPAFIALIQEL
jgi:tRNA-dihydrouridine synthase B